MTIQQTIDIPADRRLHVDLDLPETWTGDSVRFVIFPVQEETASKETAPTAWALPPKPKGLPPDMEFDFWQDRVRPGDDPFGWRKLRGAFTGPSVDEFLAEKHAGRSEV
jgi:hypothetical protein